MKPWSFYNTLFHSEKFGYYLYNALSGVMLELDKDRYDSAVRLRDGSACIQYSDDPDFHACLEKQGFLAGRDDEYQKLMVMHYLRNATCFCSSTLRLTICPTLECNFGCPYCFELGRHDAQPMGPETMDAIVSFIKSHEDARNLNVSWYGGEPTLSLDIVKALTSRFIELFPDYCNAGLVTNGYLLDELWIRELGDLKINRIQVTIDGTEQTHDSRRVLKTGGATYRRILDNIDLLMNSSWQGKLSVRVNVDRTNSADFGMLRSELMKRYQGKQLVVYPARIATYPELTVDQQCELCASEWADFIIGGFKHGRIVPEGGFFPVSGKSNVCIATSHYGFVIGPGGEMYKCFEDVGNAGMAVGSVHGKPPLENIGLAAMFSTGVDPFSDSECLGCPVLPLCGGGCARRRLRSKFAGMQSVEYCSMLKYSLVPFLEAYLDTLQTKEICQALLGTNNPRDMSRGYRMVQPEKKASPESENPLYSTAGH